MSALPPVVILGAGLTGLSAAYHLRQKSSVLVEREQRVGGLARSTRRDGYTFDATGHWLHVRDPKIDALMRQLFAPNDWGAVCRRTRVYSHETLLPYPFQANLYGLPLEVVKECLVGFFEARRESTKERGPARTFEAYVIERFGTGIARHFFVPYNSKLWGMHPDQLTPAMLSRYVPVPDPAEVIGGALGEPQEGLGYNAEFLYPKEKAGIDLLPRRLLEAIEERPSSAVPSVECRTGTTVDEIDPVRQRVKLSTAADWQPYDRLISTMPLPELVARISAVPDEVRAAARDLRWVSWRYVDVATRRRAAPDYHWVYVPEPEYPFFRVGVYSNVAPQMAPAGCAALYIEMSDRKKTPDIPSMLAALTKLGAIASPEDVAFCEPREIEYAYVVFDEAWESSTATIFEWLERVGIRSCGRYGAWTYNAMQDCLVEGMNAAAWADADEV